MNRYAIMIIGSDHHQGCDCKSYSAHQIKRSVQDKKRDSVLGNDQKRKRDKWCILRQTTAIWVNDCDMDEGRDQGLDL